MGYSVRLKTPQVQPVTSRQEDTYFDQTPESLQIHQYMGLSDPRFKSAMGLDGS
jgi:hypothetical protein